MKSFYLLTFVAILAFSFSSCQSSESKRVREEARQALPAPDPNSVATTPATTPPPTPPATNPNEPHYKCPNNCSGGVGAAAGPCPVCGTELAHNQAYHTPAATTPNSLNVTPPPATTTTTTPPAQTPTPAQNAAGVYHYTCSNGCAGGGSGATACGTCGTTLVHNQAYHN